MKTITKMQIFSEQPGEVFPYLDDLGVSGMHMTKSSMPLMGSKLNLVFLSENHKGFNTSYRWTGKVVGFKLDFTVLVTRWILNEEKIWETIGESKLIIYSWFRMHLKIKPHQDGTNAELSITYEKPKGVIGKILSLCFAKWYCKWCLKHMLHDAENSLKMKARSYENHEIGG
jgi:hypothetical protein